MNVTHEVQGFIIPKAHIIKVFCGLKFACGKCASPARANLGRLRKDAHDMRNSRSTERRHPANMRHSRVRRCFALDCAIRKCKLFNPNSLDAKQVLDFYEHGRWRQGRSNRHHRS